MIENKKPVSRMKMWIMLNGGILLVYILVLFVFSIPLIKDFVQIKTTHTEKIQAVCTKVNYKEDYYNEDDETDVFSYFTYEGKYKGQKVSFKTMRDAFTEKDISLAELKVKEYDWCGKEFFDNTKKEIGKKISLYINPKDIKHPIYLGEHIYFLKHSGSNDFISVFVVFNSIFFYFFVLIAPSKRNPYRQAYEQCIYSGGNGADMQQIWLQLCQWEVEHSRGLKKRHYKNILHPKKHHFDIDIEM